MGDLFETLRRLAEADTADSGTDKRRPSWGPALVLGDEILAALANLNYPHPDKKVARLWAMFVGPGKLNTLLRDEFSTLPMPNVRVRAFELRLGAERSGERLLQAKRSSSGLWSVDASIRSRFPRVEERWQAYDARSKVRDRVNSLDYWIRRAEGQSDDNRERLRNELIEAEAALAKCQEAVAEVEADRTDYSCRCRAFGELIKQRVAEFAGDPFAQMVAGAHVTGNCAICGRHLSDVRSVEHGVGPECFGRIAPQLRAYLARPEAA